MENGALGGYETKRNDEHKKSTSCAKKLKRKFIASADENIHFFQDVVLRQIRLR